VRVTRRVLTTGLLSLAGIAAMVRISPLWPAMRGTAIDAADASRPVSLPDMALGAANAPVTIVEYAAPTCPHCAAFDRDVFPKIKTAYIDTGKVRYVLREFPLNVKDVACAMLARRIADADGGRYVAIIETMWREQARLLEKTTDTLQRIGRQAGLSAQAVEDCLKDQALLDRINADRAFAKDALKVDGTPTFFINGEIIVGEAPFEEFESKIKPLLKS
jgi:protein-disulfide isomerase